MKMKDKSLLILVGVCMAVLLLSGCGGVGDNGGGNGGSALSEFISIAGATFTAGAPPASTGSAASPTVDKVDGPSDMINGGSGVFTVNFSDPNGALPREADRLFSAATVSKLIVVVQGDAGYYSLPVTGTASFGSYSFTVITYASLNSNLVIGFAVVDSSGNVSAYVARDVRIHRTGVGDIKISLSWDQPEDLDLHVIDPFGEEIYYDHPNSASGGHLDLDSNGACIIDDVDNENVYWALGAAPAGTYKVRVKYEMHCSKPETNYLVTIIAGNELQTFQGSFTAAQEGQVQNVIQFSY